MLADQEQGPEEVLERVLRGQRRGQADEAEAGEQPGDPFAAADQEDLHAERDDQDRELEDPAEVGTIMSLRLRLGCRCSLLV